MTTEETIINFCLNTLISIIGAFVGFLLAIRLQNITTRNKSQLETLEVLDALIEELSDLEQGINEHLNKAQIVNHCIQTPTWDAIVYSGFLLRILNNDKYCIIIQIYSSIKYYNNNREHQREIESLNLLKAIQSNIHKINNTDNGKCHRY